MAKIISVTGGKGGSGKTFCSVNLATELASRGNKVLLFDADINCSNVFIMINVKPGNLFQKYFEGGATLKETIVESPHGVSVISAGVNILRFIQFENEYNLSRLTRDLKELSSEYDFVIFDHAAGISQETLKFYEISDEIIFVANPEVTALTDLYRVIKVVVTNNLCDNLNLVVNKVKNIDWAVNLYREVTSVMSRFKLNKELFLLGPILSDEEHVIMSIQKRTPLVKLFPKTPIKGGFSLAVTRLLYKIGGKIDKEGSFSEFF